MQIKWDFHELYEFGDRLVNRNSMYNLDTAFMTATQNIARVLHQRLLVNTPVDTGNLRKMWSAGDNLKFTVEKQYGGFQVTLINTARRDSEDGFMYGRAVNDGHRTPSGRGWVMGRFFVERSIIQVENSARLESLIMKELRKWWDGV